tara:strand:+ start:164 stop:634 length:471 start_codon:yes stop_codon:yes gene_type:complete
MENRKPLNPSEFFSYITKPLSPSDIDLWYKANNILPEKSQLFLDFVESLLLTVKDTYLGYDVLNNEQDIINHFNWCWNKVIKSFLMEGIEFIPRGEHYDYFWAFFEESFYDTYNQEDVIDKATYFFTNIFVMDRIKSKSELDIYTDLYKTMDSGLI